LKFWRQVAQAALDDCSKVKKLVQGVEPKPALHASSTLARSVAGQTCCWVRIGVVVPAGQLAKGDGQVVWLLEHVLGVTSESQTEGGFCIVQSVHAPPETPHAVSMKPASQTPVESQQPVQLDGPHALDGTHWPVVGEQVVLAGQTAHVLPPEPHSPCVVPPWQTPVVSQQPAQLSELHWLLNWQMPPPKNPPSTGSGPGGPGKKLGLHTELPAQTRHCSPPLPHCEFVSPGWHVPVLSQQPSQFWGPHPPPSPAEQNPLLQLRPATQSEHANPVMPHALDVLPGKQVLPSQQPAQFCGPHPPASTISWQKPPGQTLPAGHAVQAWPPNPHAVVVSPATHTLPWQQPGQLSGPHAPESNCIWQKPPWHVVPAGQSVHACPPTPHAVGEPPPAHVPFAAQHPLQLLGLHGGTVHFPPVHVSPAGQVVHAAPPIPQPPTPVPVEHSLPLQQPMQFEGPQEVTCISQTLPWHVKLAGQAAQLSPPWPQSAFVVPRWQMPFGSQQPSQLLGPHCGGMTTQLPPSHVVFGGQKMHWLPNVPHS
jgi:hypothetical protein